MLIIETLDIAREEILAISYLRRDLGRSGPDLFLPSTMSS